MRHSLHAKDALGLAAYVVATATLVLGQKATMTGAPS